MGFPFCQTRGRHATTDVGLARRNRASLWFDVRLGGWIAQDGFDSPEPTHHQGLGNSATEALYMLMVQYMVVPMPKRRDVA